MSRMTGLAAQWQGECQETLLEFPYENVGMGRRKLVKALRKSKIGVSERREIELPNIRNAIDSGHPVITCVTTRRELTDHWVVVYGYVASPDRLFIVGKGIPCLGNRKQFRFDIFASTFRGKDGFGLIFWGKD